MNFIERIFGLSPDHGSGVTEVAVVLALAGSLSLALGLWRRRARANRPSVAAARSRR